VRTCIISILTLILTLGLTACDGDETVLESVVKTDSTEILVTGTAILRPWTDFHLNMVKIHNEEIAVDSVKFADSLCRMGYGAFRVWGDDYYLGAYYYAPPPAPARFGSGDTARVEIYGARGTTTVDLKLLAIPEDSVVIVDGESDHSVAIGETVDLVWRSIPNADWYGISYGFWYDSAGHSYNLYNGSIATQDTTAQLPGGPRNGGYGMNINAFTGPVPGSGDYNVVGNGLVGYIYSPSGNTHFNVVVGQAAAPSGGASGEPPTYPAPEGSVLDYILQSMNE